MSASKQRGRPSIPDQVVEKGLTFLQRYFQEAGAEVSISAQVVQSQESAECVYTLKGALQPLRRQARYLTSLTRLTAAAMNAGGRQRHLCQLDLDGDLFARRALLEVIAEDAAAVAKHTHKRAIIEGLSAGERRQIHQYVTEHDEIETLSDGEDEFRYLMVALKT